VRRQEDNDSRCRIRTQLIGHRVRTRDNEVFVGEWFVKRRRRCETFQVILGLVEFRLNGRDVNGGFLVTHASVWKLQRRSLTGGVVLSCCSCLPKPRQGASTDRRSRSVQMVNTSRPRYVNYNRASGFELWSELRAGELYQYDQRHREVPTGFMGNRPDVLGQS